jgi:hypothetical protein
MQTSNRLKNGERVDYQDFLRSDPLFIFQDRSKDATKIE